MSWNQVVFGREPWNGLLGVTITMAGEIQVAHDIGDSLYVVILNQVGQIWNPTTLAFETITAANWSEYAVFLTDQSGTGIYLGNFPTAITILGDYRFFVYEAGTPGTAAVGDLVIPGCGNVVYWSGTQQVPIAGIGSINVDSLYDSFVVNTTSFRSVLQGLASIELGGLVESSDHSTSTFTDVNDPNTVRVKSANTVTTRTVTLN